jgi:hypothetical protein
MKQKATGMMRWLTIGIVGSGTSLLFTFLGHSVLGLILGLLGLLLNGSLWIVYRENSHEK